MIRTLLVDDDAMAVLVHRGFIERLGGFEVVGEATTGYRAVELTSTLRPDLVLLDMYLPDLDGIEVLRRVRSVPQTALDVIAITSAKDVDILHAAMQLGVVHYIVKPFTFATFAERLHTYAAARAQLASMHDPGQPEVDRLYRLLRPVGGNSLPKGISGPTLAHVTEVLRGATEGTSAVTVADRTGLSSGVARRYLRFLADAGSVDLRLRYGSAGRPEHLYRWVGGPGS